MRSDSAGSRRLVAEIEAARLLRTECGSVTCQDDILVGEELQELEAAMPVED